MNYLDALARLGIGNAHPGGFSATLAQLSRHPITPGSRVLEVGCGTGRTACYLAAQGCYVTAVDIRPRMIRKARRRAKEAGVSVRFAVADACRLPLADRSYDAVLCESVTLFLKKRIQALREYRRVLRPGGWLYDREIMAAAAYPKTTQSEAEQLFKIKHIPTESEWKVYLKKAGFTKTEITDKQSFQNMYLQQEILHPDHSQKPDPGVMTNEEVMKVVRRYDNFMLKHQHHFNSGLIVGSYV